MVVTLDVRKDSKSSVSVIVRGACVTASHVSHALGCLKSRLVSIALSIGDKDHLQEAC